MNKRFDDLIEMVKYIASNLVSGIEIKVVLYNGENLKQKFENITNDSSFVIATW